MAYQIDSEIDRFCAYGDAAVAGAGAASGLIGEKLCEFGFLLRPKTHRAGGGEKTTPKQLALTLMGLTHGNEWAGVSVLNELLAMIFSGLLPVRVPVAFVLGNPWAARLNKRFIERDLNRSFARTSGTDVEGKRATELSKVLNQTACILDYHQTSRRSERPFFIFPYHPASFALARACAPRLTVVTHWGKPFSSEGMCTDEYVISQGGTGISVELGQNGFDPYQIAVGVECGMWAIHAAAQLYAPQGLIGGPEPQVAVRAATDAPGVEPEFELYTWAEIMPWPASGYVELSEKWNNFENVAAGEQLGTADGRPIHAPVSGKILFPKFLTREQQQQLTSRPTELCRIMKKIAPAELPT